MEKFLKKKKEFFCYFSAHFKFKISAPLENISKGVTICRFKYIQKQKMCFLNPAGNPAARFKKK